MLDGWIRGGGTHEVIGTGSQAHFRLVRTGSCPKYVFSQENASVLFNPTPANSWTETFGTGSNSKTTSCVSENDSYTFGGRGLGLTCTVILGVKSSEQL